MAFIEDGNKYGFDHLLVGLGHKNMELVVPTGKVVKRGDAVNAKCELSDGKDLFGIVLQDVDASSEDKKTVVVVSGEVLWEGIEAKGETEAADFIKAARDKGIIVRRQGGNF